MNEHDRSNLNFLLYSNAEVLHDWYEKMGPEDHEYAQELLIMYSAELCEASAALVVECEMEMNPMYAEANAVLDRFKL